MSSPTALYRRYRPDTFQDVIGQEHVTEPLMTALRKNRVNHAYLFSGPRGCGKTTSARILARCLNCEQGPTPEPCGVCPSCVELARGGAGSLDVIEIDAASHGGVDDARDLRERATFAPVRDRYKIFIIDEAHMVTSAGFNALLKIVEEPPEHIKFIFATTEPDKVIGTIRSRTHHYPFRLVPPEPLMAYLEKLCSEEHVAVEPGVLSLVVRAGGGSVRDSLSVLDQLMAGAGAAGIDYELAVALLGYTHAALLDDVVDAVSAGDSGTVFRAVDRVIQTGHDPRRFVEDLLERFRDLIIVQAVPEAAESILRGVPADQLARMRTQAQSLGAAELSRAADITNAAFNEMTGASSPRLHLELLCARLMLPGADSDHGVAARLDRLERRLSFEHGETRALPEAAAAVPPPARSESAASAPAAAPAPPAEPAPAAPVAAPAPQEAVPAAQESAPAPPDAVPAAQESAPPAAPAAEQPRPEPEQPRPEPEQPRPEPEQPRPEPSAPVGATGGGSGSVEMFRRAWPEVLEALTAIKRLTWILVSQNANVAGFDGRTLTLAFANSGSVNSFSRGDHPDNVRRAVQQVLGVDVQIDATTGGNGPVPVAARGVDAGPKALADSPGDSRAPETPPVPEPAREAGAGPGPSTPRDETGRTGHSTQSGPDASQPAPATAPARTPSTAPSAAPSAADIAWGLAPAPPPAGDGATSSPAAPEMDSMTEPAPEATRWGRDGGTHQQPESGPPAGVQPAGVQPTGVQPADDPYADDPYADIPYADDEPPAEWDEPLPEDEGRSRPSAPRVPRSPVHGAMEPAGDDVSAPDLAAGQPRTAEPTARDPWAYARESAPGVWSVGSEPNTGSGADEGRPSPQGDVPPSYAPAAAQPPARPEQPARHEQPGSARVPHPAPAEGQADDGGRNLSMYQRLSRRAAQQAQEQAKVQAAAVRSQPIVEDIPSADDETVEASGLFGRAAVERILGGKLVEERSLDGTVLPPR
ncbi:DNA polymerase III subunit gamma and tau [Sinomonas sp.]|uniref:DNA polymerase III subunit gamma and tau n=1 Tax=Sinomonas sp. TaxID=1914986 RepID=UPI002FE163AB